MNFPKIYDSKEILDIILNQLKKEVKNDPFDYINKFQLKINDKYEHILDKLPDYNTKDEYYLFMIKNIVDQSTMEKHKNHYLKTLEIINSLSERYKREIKKQKDLKQKNKLKREFLGRISSVIKKLDSTNKKLIEYKKLFKRIPKIDKNLFTIVLIGAPNSGKTTLLKQITNANPEINSYSFTTKSLNLGFFKKRQEIIQVIDTPGLIHSEFKEMNIIEKQALVAIKTVSDVIVFLYNSYQDFNLQNNILEKIKQENPDKKTYVYSSFSEIKMKNQKNITLEDILDKNL